jgi:hypothetical protein
LHAFERLGQDLPSFFEQVKLKKAFPKWYQRRTIHPNYAHGVVIVPQKTSSFQMQLFVCILFFGLTSDLDFEVELYEGSCCPTSYLPCTTPLI